MVLFYTGTAVGKEVFHYGFLVTGETIPLDASTSCDFSSHLGSGGAFLRHWLLGLVHILEVGRVGAVTPSGRDRTNDRERFLLRRVSVALPTSLSTKQPGRIPLLSTVLSVQLNPALSTCLKKVPQMYLDTIA